MYKNILNNHLRKKNNLINNQLSNQICDRIYSNKYIDSIDIYIIMDSTNDNVVIPIKAFDDYDEAVNNCHDDNYVIGPIKLFKVNKLISTIPKNNFVINT